MMDGVYLIHLENGRHYIGHSTDIDARVKEHRDTTWTRYDAPVTLPDGRKKNGEVHGAGSTFLGAMNAQGIAWSVVKVWEGKTRDFERWLKKKKSSPRYCPVCSPGNRRLANV